MLKQVDWLRIDHFRGFDAFWVIDPNEKTAVNGKWVSGPGAAFFACLEKYFGSLPIIAEDLGLITPSVEMLRDMFNFPGMKVLQFLFEGAALDMDLPNVVAYTGTHDNDTLAGWYRKSSVETKRFVQKTLRLAEDTDLTSVCWRLIEFTLKSAAANVIIPLQDLLVLGSEARMNTPGTVGGNWQWRCRSDALTRELAAHLADLTAKANR